MSPVPIVPDVAPHAHAGVRVHANARPHGDAFASVLDDVGALFGKAQHAEDVFAVGRGDLQSAIYERARADVALAVAAAAASRASQAIQSIFNMPV